MVKWFGARVSRRVQDFLLLSVSAHFTDDKTLQSGFTIQRVEWRSERDTVSPVEPCSSVGLGTRIISSFTYIKD